jgi:hypothetical protein
MVLVSSNVNQRFAIIHPVLVVMLYRTLLRLEPCHKEVIDEHTSRRCTTSKS